MERVQFQQEQMLAELKDLVDKNLFTESETKEIFKKRTAFETALVRRVPKKSDFLRYIAYEMALEQLRRKRAVRLGIRGPPTVSDYALVKRQYQIFERALKKFKSDVDLWKQYIEVAKREGARTLVGRVTARALQLHPNVPTLYILAASHELENQSPSAARTLLQRGLRLNRESVELWREYVKMELVFAESIRRRWEMLGVRAENDGEEGAGREILEGRLVAVAIRHAAEAAGPKVVDELGSLAAESSVGPALRRRVAEELAGLRRQESPGVGGQHAEGVTWTVDNHQIQGQTRRGH
ncbi:hypothetical protein AX15_007704 [Amanita polypyramis BW_CC]|nr:hypothetical protein AX15_007704 [Amanita polypyramis BW_CC]